MANKFSGYSSFSSLLEEVEREVEALHMRPTEEKLWARAYSLILRRWPHSVARERVEEHFAKRKLLMKRLRQTDFTVGDESFR